MTCILVIDNYDSFVYTIAGYLTQLGAECTVLRNDAVPLVPVGQGHRLGELRSDGGPGRVDLDGFDGVLVSPGPGAPCDAGATIPAILECARIAKPMFGVCLGHQALGEAFGGTVEHAPQLMHGKTSRIVHDGALMFAGLSSPFTATRYHSLAVREDTIPSELTVTARSDTGLVMGLSHRELPLHGVQFHPESVLTEGGHRLLANWLETIDGRSAAERSDGLAPLVRTL